MKNSQKYKGINKNKDYIAMSNTYDASSFVLYQRLFELQASYGYVTASDAYLSKCTGLSLKTVRRNLSKLESDGFITRETKMVNENRSKRKIYLNQEIVKPEFDYSELENHYNNDDEQESAEELVSELDNIVKDLPSVNPPSGMFGPKSRKQTKKTKEQKANERALNKTFKELVVDVYPADKRGSVSKAFTVFKNLKYDDQQEVIKNIKRYVDMINIPYHKSLINCLNDGEYKDEYLDAREKSNRKRTSKTESSTAHNFNKNNSLDDYYATTSEKLNK